MSDPEIGWRDLLTLLSPVGLQQIGRIIEQAKRERGSGWIEALQDEFPTATWMIDLAANSTAEDAYKALADAYPHYPLYIVRSKIIQAHAFLRAEIDKPRTPELCS